MTERLDGNVREEQKDAQDCGVEELAPMVELGSAAELVEVEEVASEMELPMALAAVTEEVEAVVTATLLEGVITGPEREDADALVPTEEEEEA